MLDLSENLNLNEEQQKQVPLAFQTMKSTAQKLGQRIVDKERRLDELRFTHIRVHMKMKEVLTSEQIQQYDKLRGYGTGEAGQMHHNHQNHGT